MQNENTKYICNLFISICYFQKRNTDMLVYRAEITFLIPIEEMFFFIL